MKEMSSLPLPQAEGFGAEQPADLSAPLVGLRVRTNLRAGVTLEEVGDQLSDWWSNVTSSVSSALSGTSAE